MFEKFANMFASVKKAKKLHDRGEHWQAIEIYLEAAEKGDAEACYRLAKMYGLNERGISKCEPELEIKWLEKAAEYGYPAAAFDLRLAKRNLMLTKAMKKKEQEESAARYARKEEEAIEKMNNAIQLEHSEEYAKALALYRQIAKIEEPFMVVALAAAKIGLFYGQGWGVPYDYKLAHSWFIAAKNRGYEQGAEALDNLEDYEGMRLALLGQEGGQDIGAGNYRAAREKLTQAASILRDKDRYEIYTGHMIKTAVDCAVLLGNLSAGGQGGPVNYDEARMWHSLAIQEGDAGAADMLKGVNEMERLDRELQRLR